MGKNLGQKGICFPRFVLCPWDLFCTRRQRISACGCALLAVAIRKSLRYVAKAVRQRLRALAACSREALPVLSWSGSSARPQGTFCRPGGSCNEVKPHPKLKDFLRVSASRLSVSSTLVERDVQLTELHSQLLFVRASLLLLLQCMCTKAQWKELKLTETSPRDRALGHLKPHGIVFTNRSVQVCTWRVQLCFQPSGSPPNTRCHLRVDAFIRARQARVD